MGRLAKEYALYQGDTFLALGTVKEIAENTGFKRQSIFKWRNHAYINGDTPYERKFIVIEVEKEDDYGTNFNTT